MAINDLAVLLKFAVAKRQLLRVRLATADLHPQPTLWTLVAV